ncbi:hypothetical protein CRYUN_Cryun40dG0055100 [Craigia yunnanensis]
MATLSIQPHYSPFQFRRFRPSNFHLKVVPRFSRQFYGKKVRVMTTSRGNVNVRGRDGVLSISCFSKTNAEIERVSSEEKEEERPPFDINLAVILGGFAFEAYTTPPENLGRREIDAADCKTVYLSETKEPTWNEDLTFNIKQPPSKYIQVAAWDANLVTPHKRMGNAGINLENLCDGNLHEVLVELEGMGGGGKLQLEVKYKSFDEIVAEAEKMWWKLPLVSEFLQGNGFESSLKMFVGIESVPARQFVEYAFGQLKSFNDAYFLKERLLNGNKNGIEGVGTSKDFAVSEMSSYVESSSETSFSDTNTNNENNSEFHLANAGMANGQNTKPVAQVGTVQFDKYFWKNSADFINQNVVQKLGVPVPEKLKWDGFDLLNKIGLQSRKVAEAKYIESGLATPDDQDIQCDKVLESGFATPEDPENKNDKAIGPLTISTIQSSLPDIKKATQD